MSQKFSKIVASACLFILIAAPIVALYMLFNIQQFAGMAQNNIDFAIQWPTVTDVQWYGLWFLVAVYVGVGLAGLFFLRRAFANFAKGQLFNQNNSRDLRIFSMLLFAQALAKPLLLSLSSVLLSFNHPAGQKMLSVSFGSDELTVVGLAMILWVMSDLLVKGGELEHENKQFV